MFNFGASKPRVKGGPWPLGPPGSAPADTQTNTQIHRQTDRHDRKHYLPTYAGGNERK